MQSSTKVCQYLQACCKHRQQWLCRGGSSVSPMPTRKTVCSCFPPLDPPGPGAPRASGSTCWPAGAAPAATQGRRSKGASRSLFGALLNTSRHFSIGQLLLISCPRCRPAHLPTATSPVAHPAQLLSKHQPTSYASSSSMSATSAGSCTTAPSPAGPPPPMLPLLDPPLLLAALEAAAWSLAPNSAAQASARSAKSVDEKADLT